MSGLEDREKAFEAKFEHDEELQFKVDTRAARLFGLWAAAQMGMKGDEAETYAKQITEMELDRGGHEKLITEVEKDLAAKGITSSRHRLEHQMNELYGTAKADIAGDIKIKA